MDFKIEIIDNEFSPYEKLNNYQNIKNNVGAQSIFIGYMRDFRENSSVDKMLISHYKPMTEKCLKKLTKKAINNFSLINLYIAHRVGEVKPNSPIVVVSSLSSHRANAISATEFLIEEIKHTVPFWKKEFNKKSKKGFWVDNNTDNTIKIK